MGIADRQHGDVRNEPMSKSLAAKPAGRRGQTAFRIAMGTLVSGRLSVAGGFASA